MDTTQTTQDFAILIRLPGDRRETHVLTAHSYTAAQERAAQLFGVSPEDTALVSIINRGPQAAARF